MKKSYQRWVGALLAGGCVVNAYFLFPNAWTAIQSFRAMQGKSNVERRLIQKGGWYQALLEVDRTIPPKASVRLVSSAPPWYLAYYLYPRLLLKGSDHPEDRDLIRNQFPDEWVLVYQEQPTAEMKAYPPLTPAAS